LTGANEGARSVPLDHTQPM